MKIQAVCLLAVGSMLSACGSDNNDGPKTNAACEATVTAKESLGASASSADAPQMVASTDQATTNVSGKYRDDLSKHPGCVPRASYDGNSEVLSAVAPNDAEVPAGVPASIPGYNCAAVEWTQSNEDTSKPIVILVHGNSSGVPSWLEYHGSNAGTEKTTLSTFKFTVETETREQIVTKLLAQRYRVYGFDARTDLVKGAVGNSNNNSFNMDHGWAVPMYEAMLKAVIKANPNRKISMMGHSLGVTIIRDALRRLYNEHKAGVVGSVNPFASLADVIHLSGASHGVVGGSAGCNTNPDTLTMTGSVNCELGDRDAYVGTYFENPFNGPSDVFATPCADGDYAFGDHDACGGNLVEYTSIVMEDISDGKYQDEFVTEQSANLDMAGCIDNHLISLGDYDASGYFLNGLFANHFGSARADVSLAYVLAKLSN